MWERLIRLEVWLTIDEKSNKLIWEMIFNDSFKIFFLYFTKIHSIYKFCYTFRYLCSSTANLKLMSNISKNLRFPIKYSSKGIFVILKSDLYCCLLLNCFQFNVVIGTYKLKSRYSRWQYNVCLNGRSHRIASTKFQLRKTKSTKFTLAFLIYIPSNWRNRETNMI